MFPIVLNRLNMADIWTFFFKIRISLSRSDEIELRWIESDSACFIPGGGVPVGGSSAAAAGVGGLPQKQQAMQGGGDRYAALAELDTVFGPSVPATSVYNPTSISQGWDITLNTLGTHTVNKRTFMKSILTSIHAGSIRTCFLPWWCVVFVSLQRFVWARVRDVNSTRAAGPAWHGPGFWRWVNLQGLFLMLSTWYSLLQF